MRGTQQLKTILFHVLLISVLYKLSATAGQRVCVQLLSASVTGQSHTDDFALLVITDLKHRLQTGFVVSVGLPLLSAPCFCFFNKPRTVGRSTHAALS